MKVQTKMKTQKDKEWVVKLHNIINSSTLILFRRAISKTLKDVQGGFGDLIKSGSDQL
jgi:hypothetical protein